MRILFNVFLDLRRDGAGVTHFVEVARNLQAQGHEVLALAPGYRPGPQKNWDLPVWFVPTLPKSLLALAIYELLNAFFLIYALLNFRPDVVYSRMGYLALFPPFLCRLFRAPYLLEVNSVVVDELRARGLSPWMIHITNSAHAWNLRWADLAICVSKGTAKEVIRRYQVSESKVVVVPNGVATDRFFPRDQASCRAEKGLPVDRFIVGFVGSMTPWQGLDTVLDAIGLIREQRDSLAADLLFVLIGDGEYRKHIEERIQRMSLTNVQITGWVAYSDIPIYIGACDICLALIEDVGGWQTSLRSPLKVFEYLACGRVVVGTRVDGLEVFPAGGNYLRLIPQRQPAALASALVDLYENRSRLIEWGLYASSEISAMHSWQSSVFQLVNLMQQVSRR
jgi:glycosyltransferase involved in cell wall biosynthesis